MAENEIDPEELHFLILHQLYQTCPAAAGILEREATERGLLPTRTDIFGNDHNLSYAQLEAKYPHVPHNGLRLLLQRCGVAAQTGGSHGATTSLLSDTALFYGGQPTRLTSTSNGSKGREWEVGCVKREVKELQVDVEELHFLILHQLYQTCPAAADVLEREANDRGLLPRCTDIFGTQHKLTYEELLAKYAHVPPVALQFLLRRSLDAGTSGGSCGTTTSLLSEGLLGAPNLGQGVFCASTSAPTTSLSLAQRLRQRETGIPIPCLQGMQLLDTAMIGSLLQHQRSVRGHRGAVYCAVLDWTGQKVITCSADYLVKCVVPDLELSDCFAAGNLPGHVNEVTYLAVNICSSIVASGSNDTTIRCWSLKEPTLGHPISVLKGHTAPVSIVTFSKALPDALLSSSRDGTCRIWNVRDPKGQAMHVLRATAPKDPVAQTSRPGCCNGSYPLIFGPHPWMANTRGGAHGNVGSWGPRVLANGSQHEVSDLRMHVCAFSLDGRFIFATASDYSMYVWLWDLEKKGHIDAVPMDALGAERAQVDMDIVDIDGAKRRKPKQIGRLAGHAKDVHLLYVSFDGERVATGSRDGTVRVWQHEQRRGPGRRPFHYWEPAFTFTCLLDDDFASALRRRREVVPSPSIRQLAWSHDGSKILAAANDNTVRVLDAASGVQLHVLKLHSAPVLVLEFHPSDSRLALTASLDGLTVVWDIQKGQTIFKFSSEDTTKSTRPGYDGWVEVIPLIRGHWTQNGEGLVLSDAAGQLHFYGLGCSDMMAYARYDQFFSSDYRPIRVDEEGRVFDEEYGTEAHMRAERDSLVDFWGDPYPRAYQAAFRDRRVTQLTLEEAQAVCD